MWKPGESGNPNGRPKKDHSITDMFHQLFDEKPDLKKAIVSKIAALALEGDSAAYKLVWQYMDGMPKQSIEVQDNNMQIKVVDYVRHSNTPTAKTEGSAGTV